MVLPESRPAHELAETPSWDTKMWCSCGKDFENRMRFYEHRGDAYRDLAASGSLPSRTQCEARIENALRAAWAKYDTTRDWYDAVGIKGMTAVVMGVLDDDARALREVRADSLQEG